MSLWNLTETLRKIDASLRKRSHPSSSSLPAPQPNPGRRCAIDHPIRCARCPVCSVCTPRLLPTLSRRSACQPRRSQVDERRETPSSPPRRHRASRLPPPSRLVVAAAVATRHRMRATRHEEVSRSTPLFQLLFQPLSRVPCGGCGAAARRSGRGSAPCRRPTRRAIPRYARSHGRSMRRAAVTRRDASSCLMIPRDRLHTSREHATTTSF